MKLGSLLQALAALAMLSVPAASFADEAEDSAKTILVFGDSLTWGWKPVSPIFPTTRHDKEDRWSEVMAQSLGEGYDVITEGLSGRTTAFDDPQSPGLMNGLDDFDSIFMSHEPLDLVIIMLGTNDAKTYFEKSAQEIGEGMSKLASLAANGLGIGIYVYGPPKVLIISPPPIGDEVDPLVASVFEGVNDKIAEMPAIYADIAASVGGYFFDAATVVEKDEVGVDGIHLLAEGNEDLGEAVAEKVREILE